MVPALSMQVLRTSRGMDNVSIFVRRSLRTLWAFPNSPAATKPAQEARNTRRADEASNFVDGQNEIEWAIQDSNL